MTAVDVAVLLPLYNGRDFVMAQVESIMAQTGVSLELIVVDDGSTDGGVRLLERIEDPRLRVFRLPSNRGQMAALSEAILRVSPEVEWVAFADQDDIWLEDKLLLSVAAAVSRGVKAVFTDMYEYREASPTCQKLVLDAEGICPAEYPTGLDILTQNPVYGCTLVVASDLARQIANAPTSVLHDRWLGYLAAREGALLFLPRSTMYYRVHSRNTIGVAHGARWWLLRPRDGIRKVSGRSSRKLEMLGAARELSADECFIASFLQSSPLKRLRWGPRYFRVLRRGTRSVGLVGITLDTVAALMPCRWGRG